ncbi:hypothetical protein D3H55_06410 [Bacillus salacetis]|uniref:Yip1 domain-containing protein n=1 Tax=Bacillus salacetis TaxID=2315464 RepID=A0A3A1R203_9BACI|nr:hypothetical protein [Bacillus salacetis]RIW36087.1 hypothetical protein D3H55_06410 [Bacillus salacetis]
MNEIKLMKGLLEPPIYFSHLKETELLKGYKRRILALFFLTVLIYGFSAYFGMGTSPLSPKLTSLSPAEYELHKLYFIAGRVVLGILYAAFTIFFPSLLFWTFTDVPYKKLTIVQGCTLIILLLEKFSYLPFLLYFSLDWYSSPLSLGVIAQQMTEKEWIIYFLGCISVFKVGCILIQYIGLRWLTNQKPWILLIIIIVMNLLFWGVTTLLATIDFLILL